MIYAGSIGMPLHFEKIVCVLDSRSEFSARQGEAVKAGRPITDTGQTLEIGMGV